ncbi:hypothetical protein OG339_48605 (plasmid) [Streptosporangium sp. NBC_01495]|uniref:hypothetical protein n=1 Tax=Streptosporangium sp. NBC_01495 TaxID=2903899 RepID=UPI002E30ABEA|nr:hypothetical protein [Streptosporangium sp. NBC_01495]
MGFPEGRRGVENFGGLDCTSTRVYRHENVESAVDENGGEVVITVHGLDDVASFKRGYLWRVSLIMDAPVEAIAGNAANALIQANEEQSMNALRAALNRH